jgi:hypothetical protein
MISANGSNVIFLTFDLATATHDNYFVAVRFPSQSATGFQLRRLLL